MSITERQGSSVRCRHEGVEPCGTAVNGVRFDPVSRDRLLQALDGFCACGESHIVHFFAGHPTVLARTDPEYREIANRGDLNIADGASVALAMRLLGVRTGRITGSDAMPVVCDWGIPRGLRHYFYGGTPEVLEQLRAVLEREHPGIEIAGADAPPFGPVTDAGLDDAAARMRAAGAEVVWVGLGVPKQDLAADGLRERGAAPVIVCVGAAFDFVSGVKHRAPAWMRALGLEWVHRLASEPRRLGRRYLIGNPRFVAGVLRDVLRDRPSV
jgi:N-acetylglucosaminyldiphosphoundecaprenol N-acetyl-beta-D-mannosaminyltransferase